ncbi:uncharacterized protein LOC118433676 [Folsomia candida]|uniref:uncharacterized protein LOC118433676 n=1 Tax=Folsomia candida TaxID=158441 RepID=UPI001604C6C8|nr:uncharacterized protein LOC118433676 [Folsomia candida]
MKFGLPVRVVHLLLAGMGLFSPKLVQGHGESLKCENGQSRVIVDTHGPSMLSYDSWTPCAFQIEKNPAVCQIRLDFMSFKTSSANTFGYCEEDRLVIFNSATVRDGFTTCGDLTGQHIYLTFCEDCSNTDFAFIPSPTSPIGSFLLRVTPIACSSPEIVPSHCLQHFNDTRGVVRSFDYPTQQQNSHQYTVCVGLKGDGGNNILWTPCSPEDGFPDSSPFNIVTIPRQTCDTDWVAINGDQRRCDKFPMGVGSIWKPFLINVNFNQEEIWPLPLGGGYASDASSCTAMAEPSGGLFICDWFSEPSPGTGGSCQCDLNPTYIVPGVDPSIILGPPPDFGNTGFCLKYYVQI